MKDELWVKHSRQLALDLVKKEAITFGSYRLRLHEIYPDAPDSPFYIDLGVITAYCYTIRLAATLMIQELREKVVQRNFFPTPLLCGLPNRADSLTALISSHTCLDRAILRKNSQGHGFSQEVKGELLPGREVVVIDDVLSGADSKLDAIKILENHDLAVQAVLVLIDREQGGRDRLEKEGYPVFSVYRARELLQFYHNEGLISQEWLDRSLDYLQDPLGQHISLDIITQSTTRAGS